MKAQALSKLFSAAIVIFFVVTTSASAQRGGGAHGGGFHVGGSFHSSGGSSGGSIHGGNQLGSRSGGISSYSRGGPGAAGVGSYQRSHERPASEPYRPSTSPANGDQLGSTGFSAAHQNEGSTTRENRGLSAAGGWHYFAGNRYATGGSAKTPRSFSGQGDQIWENAPQNKSVPSLGVTSRSAAGFSFGNSLRLNGLGQSGANFRVGYPYGNFRRPFPRGIGGCWNCSLGFGWWPAWGFGFGSPGLYWNNPWFLGSTGYGHYGYPYGYPSGYFLSTPDQYDESAPPQMQDYPDSDSNESSVNENSQGTHSDQSAAVSVLIYLNDGSVYAVRDYWFSDGLLHYVLLNGAGDAVYMEDLDVQRTVDENAKSGFLFTLRPGPE